MMRVNWLGEWPPEIRAKLEPLVDEFLYMVPPWVYELDMRYGEAPAEDPATLGVTSWSERYRHGTIRFYPTWLSESPQAQRENVVHEIVHLTSGALVGWVGRLLDSLEKMDPPAPGWVAGMLRREWGEKLEAMTQDFAHAIATRRA